MQRTKVAYPRLEEELDKRLLSTKHIQNVLHISYWSANRKRGGETKFKEEEKDLLSNFFKVKKSELFKQ